MANQDYHGTFELSTKFEYHTCGCVARRDGITLTYCTQHNPKRGTHWKG